MNPYYQDAFVTLYHADCLDVFPLLSKDAADVIVTDPPYGISYKSNRADRFNFIHGDDGSINVPAILNSACKCLRRGRHVYIFGGGLDLTGTTLTAAVELIWDKGILGTGDLSLPWGSSHEKITFAVHEISRANREKGYGNLTARLRKGSVLRVQKVQAGATGRHPTEKPVEILRQMIESSSCLGETVLDPFAGSGSTLEAAVLEGRKAIGIEIDEGYCKTAADRLTKLALFGTLG